MNEPLGQAELLRVLHYDPMTGLFTWLVRLSQRAKVGDVAGRFRRDTGYRSIRLDGREYYAHRLAWLYMTGEWPADEIDHINGSRSDNRWANLRAADRSLNQQNERIARSTSVTGLLGAHRRHGTFRASIVVDGRKKELGAFGTAEEAHAAYVKAKRALHPGCTI